MVNYSSENINVVKLKGTNLTIDYKQINDLYNTGKYIQLSLIFYTIFFHFKNNSYSEIDNELQNFIDRFIEIFSELIIKPDFNLNKSMIEKFINLSPVITNIFALSAFKTTDHLLEKLSTSDKDSLYKIMVLYNSRNNKKIDKKIFFELDSELASLWYGIYFISSISWHIEVIQSNLKEHLLFWDKRMSLKYEEISYGYMISTYIDPKTDRIYKSNFNNLVQKKLASVSTNNKPDKKKIAVVSGLWKEGHVVYRNFLPLIESLKADYDLTLISLIEDNYKLALIEKNPIFSEVKYLSISNVKNINKSFLADNNFMMLFYIDIGMDYVSRFLANIRIAPVQIMTYGHPVSTFGSKIDYFIGGVDSENMDEIQEHYSERFVFTNGLGLKIPLPTYKIKGKIKKINYFIINCSWGINKLNYEMLNVLNEIKNKSNKKILFRLFTQMRIKDNNFIVLKKDLEDILGKDNLELFPAIPTDTYMEILEEGDIAIDSHPFAGVNSVIDNLYLRKPIITWQGWQHYNKAGSAILYKCGLSELVANSKEEYINKITKLINDDDYRKTLNSKISVIDIKSHFTDMTDISSFKKAIDYIIENQENFKEENSNESIFIN